MKVVCSACGAQYTIADEKVPAAGARIRCRKCQAVFSIPARVAEGSAPASAPRAPAQVPASEPPASRPPAAARPPAAPPAVTAPPAAHEPEAIRPAPLPTIPPAGEPLEPPPPSHARPAATQTVPPSGGVRLSEAQAGISPFPDGLSAEERVKHERARRLARVLASDIAIYNKEKCLRGVRDGNLVAVLGYEIKKSWEVYKERVTADLANSTPYFRDALNEMLGEGKKIF